MNHGKKMIAPIVVTIIFVLYFAAIGVLYLCIPELPILAKVLLVGIPGILAGVMIGVFVSRIREIKGGEEDDLSKY